MSIKKFINTVKESLGLEVKDSTKKKKALRKLIKKMSSKKSELKKALKKKLEKPEQEELQEEYEIVCIQLKKGTKLLKKLNEENKG